MSQRSRNLPNVHFNQIHIVPVIRQHNVLGVLLLHDFMKTHKQRQSVKKRQKPGEQRRKPIWLFLKLQRGMQHQAMRLPLAYMTMQRGKGKEKKWKDGKKKNWRNYRKQKRNRELTLMQLLHVCTQHHYWAKKWDN
eukprot:g5699.t1